MNISYISQIDKYLKKYISHKDFREGLKENGFGYIFVL